MGLISVLFPPWIFGFMAIYYAYKAHQLDDTSADEKYDLFTRSLNLSTFGICIGLLVFWSTYAMVVVMVLTYDPPPLHTAIFGQLGDSGRFPLDSIHVSVRT